MPYEGPREVITSVLKRLGIDPEDRMDDADQDPEYTACRAEELADYFRLYRQDDLAAEERAVLCCFLMEGLNDCLQAGRPHDLQESIFAALFSARHLHSAELEYWMHAEEPDEANWWSVTRPLLDSARKWARRERCPTSR